MMTFVRERIAAMLGKDGRHTVAIDMWGGRLAVELQVLLLLEVLIVSGDVSAEAIIADRYAAFLRSVGLQGTLTLSAQSVSDEDFASMLWAFAHQAMG